MTSSFLGFEARANGFRHAEDFFSDLAGNEIVLIAAGRRNEDAGAIFVSRFCRGHHVSSCRRYRPGTPVYSTTPPARRYRLAMTATS